MSEERERAVKAFEVAETIEKAAAANLLEARTLLREAELTAEQFAEDHNKALRARHAAEVEVKRAFGLFSMFDEIDRLFNLGAAAGLTESEKP